MLDNMVIHTQFYILRGWHERLEKMCVCVCVCVCVCMKKKVGRLSSFVW